MMKYVNADITEALKNGDVRVIAHQANCFNTMNSGVAKAIREAFPEAYTADCKTAKGDIKKLGGFSVAMTSEHGLIYNLYGQYRYGYSGEKHTDYVALRLSLQSMAHDLRHRGFLGPIGIPKLGCGLGGGVWEGEVELIVSQTLRDWDVIVYQI